MALLSDRVLLIYWPTHTEPALEDLFILPPDLEWDYVDVVDKFLDVDEVYENAESFEFFDSWPRQHTLSTLLCGNFSTALSERYVFLHTNQNLINFFRENPVYQARLASVFGNDVFGPLARFLLRPSKEIALRVSKLMQNGPPSIGVHLRLGRTGSLGKFLENMGSSLI